MSTVVTLGPVGFKPTGAYNNTREYKRLDVVIYQGSCYIAKSDSIGKLPTNTTYWELLVQKGDTGNGITSIAKTGTSGLIDTYTITYTDGTTSTFTVTNGEKGDPGEVTQAQLDETNNQVAKANMVYNALPKVSDEGDSLTLDGTANCPMKMELKGNTEQNGTPTPDSPIDVRVVTSNNSVKVIGKNLLNITNAYSNSTGLEKSYINGVASLTWNAGFAFYMEQNESHNQPLDTFDSSKTYTISFKHKGDSLYLRFDETYNNILATGTDSDYTDYSYTFTGLNQLVIKFVRKADSGTAYLKDFQIEINNQATPYEPYQSQTYPINLGTMELCKIGTYQDYIYKDSGKWYKHSEIGKVVLDGSETAWGRINSGNYFYINKNDMMKSSGGSEIAKGYSNNYYPYSYNYIYDGVPDYGFGIGYNSSTLAIRNKDITSLNDFKTWLSTHNTTLYYVLATPTTTEITDTTLISQLNAIENAVSYDTQTNIVQENYSEPFIINTECVRSLKDIFELIQ